MTDLKTLREEALKSRELSYSPYSKFAVGAVIITKDGRIFRGANIENASYPLSICAERTAIFNAYLAGVRQEEIEVLALIADSPAIVSPCGACRQVMSEMLAPTTPVVLFTLGGKQQETTVAELLPLAFNKGNMAC